MDTANVFDRTLSLDEIRAQAPAVFAEAACEALSPRYTFIPTSKVLSALINAGFVVLEARQARTHRASPLHALHSVRLRRRCETVALRDAVPEVRLWNSHDASGAYQARMSIYRAVCTNGLIVSKGAFPTVYVAHRGNVVDAVVTGALEMAERFDQLAAQVERMEARKLTRAEQIQFAERAVVLRFPEPHTCGIHPAQLLTVRRSEDLADDLYTVYNRVHEHLCRGGLRHRSASGRLVVTRRISSIRRDVDLNGRLWDLATEVLAA